MANDPVPNEPVITAADLAATLTDANPAGGGDPNRTLINIKHPAVNILPFLNNVARQAQILTAATTYGESFGSMSAARPSPKPFVVGFIVPDVPVNYIPVTSVRSKIGDIRKGSSLSSSAAGGDTLTGQPGIQPKVWTTFGTAQLRDEIIAACKSILGHPPTDVQVALIYSQFILERGIGTGKSSGCYNFNLGNYHARGSGTKFIDGGKVDDNMILPEPDKKPPGGSYFLTYDFTGYQGPRPNSPYSVYMQSWPNLSSAVYSQVAQLYGTWPGTRTAQSAEEFVMALAPSQFGGKKGGDYFGAPAAGYTTGIQRGVGQYLGSALNHGAKASEFTTTIGPPVNRGAGPGPQAAADPSTPVVGTIMDNGDITGAQDNPLDFQYGQHLMVNEKRKTITDAYAASIINDIETFRNTPPLLMMINPSSFERSYEATVDNGVKGRQGPIVHMWLEKPLSISCKGQTAAHYVVGADGSGGLAMTNRIQSISYQNLLSLVLTYKNNGIVFDNFSPAGNSGVPVVQMSVFIYYDGRIYIGSFDDFSVDDAADKPYNLEYNFKFTVRYEIEVDTNVLTDSSITTGIR